MRDAVADFAIPMSQLAKAKARDQKYKSTEPVTTLAEQAKRSFTDFAKTGKQPIRLRYLQRRLQAHSVLLEAFAM